MPSNGRGRALPRSSPLPVHLPAHVAAVVSLDPERRVLALDAQQLGADRPNPLPGAVTPVAALDVRGRVVDQLLLHGVHMGRGRTDGASVESGTTQRYVRYRGSRVNEAVSRQQCRCVRYRGSSGQQRVPRAPHVNHLPIDLPGKHPTGPGLDGGRSSVPPPLPPPVCRLLQDAWDWRGGGC